MKRIVLAVMMCLVWSPCFAQVDVTVKDINSFEKITQKKNKIVLGDKDNKSKFIAKAQMGIFENENNLSIKYNGDFGIAEIKNEKIVADGSDESINLYFIDDNNFEFEVILNKKPIKNIFEFEIEGWEDFYFNYQDTLENDYANGVGLEEEQTLQEYLETHNRPENVIGSYAVYHKTKRNHKAGETNYATGKAFHIYRPKLIDADNKEQYCDMSFNKGTLSVTCNSSWLDKASYPVILDPTIGYTTLGGSNSDSGAIIRTRCTYGTSESSGTVTKAYWGGMPYYSWNGVEVGIYGDTAGEPLTFIVEGDSAIGYTTRVVAWRPAESPNGVNISGTSVVSGTKYWSCFQNSGAGVYIAYDSGEPYSEYSGAVTYSTWADIVGGTTTSTVAYSTYFEYTADPTGTPIYDAILNDVVFN